MVSGIEKFSDNKEIIKTEKFKKVILKSKPIRLFFILTTNCSLNCIMCLQEKGHTLPFKAFNKLRVLFPYVELIDWQGGEVLLVDYFKNLFREITLYKNIKQRIYTSGIPLDKKWSKIIANTHTDVTISLDGVKKKTYESIRKHAKFENFLQKIEYLNSVCTEYNKLSINTVVMRRNLKELHLFPRFCKKYGIVYARFDFLKVAQFPLEESLNPRAVKKQNLRRSALFSKEDIFIKRDENAIRYLSDVIVDIENEFKEFGIEFNYTFRTFLTHGNGHLKTVSEDRADDDKKNYLNCPCPWESLFIDYYGRIKPDCLCYFTVGNIFDSKLDDIWNGPEMQTYRQRIIEGRPAGWCTDICVARAVDKNKFEML